MRKHIIGFNQTRESEGGSRGVIERERENLRQLLGKAEPQNKTKKENRGRNELIDDERGSVVYLRERGGKRCRGMQSLTHYFPVHQAADFCFSHRAKVAQCHVSVSAPRSKAATYGTILKSHTVLLFMKALFLLIFPNISKMCTPLPKSD